MAYALKFWLDDERPPPGWTLVREAAEAIASCTQAAW
jgi:hypothetical protein